MYVFQILFQVYVLTQVFMTGSWTILQCTHMYVHSMCLTCAVHALACNMHVYTCRPLLTFTDISVWIKQFSKKLHCKVGSNCPIAGGWPFKIVKKKCYRKLVISPLWYDRVATPHNFPHGWKFAFLRLRAESLPSLVTCMYWEIDLEIETSV